MNIILFNLYIPKKTPLVYALCFIFLYKSIEAMLIENKLFLQKMVLTNTFFIEILVYLFIAFETILLPFSSPCLSSNMSKLLSTSI